MIPIETVRTDRLSMRFFRFGAGPRPLVILPGLSVVSVMGAAEAVARQYQSMTADFTIHVLDRREDLPPVYPVREMAMDTAEALRALGLRDVCLFGASQGGMMAMAMAIEAPELVSRLAVAAAAARMTPGRFAVLDEWLRLARTGNAEALYEAFGEKLYPPPVFDASREALRSMAAAVTAEDLARFLILGEGARDFDELDRLDRIRCPFLAVGDTEDRVLGPEALEEIVSRLGGRPDFQHHLYRGFGHAVFDLAPDFPDRLTRFFLG